MTYAEMVGKGIILVESEYPDYVGVTLGPDDDEGTCVAVGYAHAEQVTTSVDLDTDEATEVTRWLAYDATDGSAPGTRVGRTNAGYATKEEAVLALVDEYADRLVAAGFPVDEGRKEMGVVVATTPWDASEVKACPYLDDEDDFPVVIRIPTPERRATLSDDIDKAIDTIMGGWHPEASRRARVAGRRLAMRMSQFLPALWDAGVELTVDIRPEVAVDSYGNTWLEDGDPFKALDIKVYYAICDDRYDRRDRRHVRAHGSMEVDLYEPADDDPEQIVQVVAMSGEECVATNELGVFVESDSSGVGCDEDIEKTVDEAFFKFATGVMAPLVGRPVAKGTERVPTPKDDGTQDEE